jgi:methionine sulfoxide reductase heme-binding subunit
MNGQTWWFISRASGMVSWVLLCASCLWGMLMITRMLKPADRPAWLLDLHRWLGALTVITTGLHIAGLVADNFVYFGWSEVLVPQASPWKTEAVSAGVVALYLLVLVQASSLAMKHLPRKLWRGIHLSSYLALVLATVHGFAAGTDAGAKLVVLIATAALAVLSFAFVARLLQQRARRLRQ